MGKSCSSCRTCIPSSGHPHAGGEIEGGIIGARGGGGPSPRGWGNHGGLWLEVQCLRAIPTRVGKSPLMVATTNAWPGHPHAGGEIIGFNSIAFDLAGPSPRGWGNPQQPQHRGFQPRAIPTRVGKSRRHPPTRGQASGHPHAGGEIHFQTALATASGGPSPRGWGNPCSRPAR